MHPRLRAGLFAAALLIAASGCAQKAKHPAHAVLPTWTHSEISRLKIEQNYEFIETVPPAFQLGDFDGDGKPDVATMIRNKSSNKVGILILHRGSYGAHILGAGQSFGTGGDDWNWMKAWSVIPTTQLPRGLSKGNDALVVEKADSKKTALYWTGSEYAWMPWGD